MNKTSNSSNFMTDDIEYQTILKTPAEAHPSGGNVTHWKNKGVCSRMYIRTHRKYIYNQYVSTSLARSFYYNISR